LFSLPANASIQRFSCWPEVKRNLGNYREYLRQTAYPSLIAGNMTLVDLIGLLYAGAPVDFAHNNGALLVTNAGVCANQTAAALFADAAFNHDINVDMVRAWKPSQRCECDCAIAIEMLPRAYPDHGADCICRSWRVWEALSNPSMPRRMTMRKISACRRIGWWRMVCG
jgi:hypothetical protein